MVGTARRQQHLHEEPVVDLRTEHLFPGTPDEVAAMVADETFLRDWCLACGAREVEATVSGTAAAGAFTATTRRAYPTGDVPAFAKRFVGDAVTLQQVDAWSRDAEGRWTATSQVELVGLPARMDARAELVPRGDATRQVVTGTVRAQVPLVGGKLEQVMHGKVVEALDREEHVGRAYLMA